MCRQEDVQTGKRGTGAVGTEQFLAQHVRLKTPEARASSLSQTIPLSAPVFVQQAFIRCLLYARPGSELCRCSSVGQALLLWSAVLGESLMGIHTPAAVPTGLP